MTLNKKWLLEEIETEPNPGIKLALERVFQKYTEAPVKGTSGQQTTLKEFDRDKTYSKLVHYYMDNLKFIEQYPDETIRKEKANAIALDIVNREIQRRNLK